MTTPTGTSPTSRATRSAAVRSAAPTSAERGTTRRAAGPADQPDDVGHDQPDEADESGDRDPGGGGQRGQGQEDAPLALDVDPEVAGRRVAQEHPVQGPGAPGDADAGEQMSGVAMARRGHDAPPRPPSRNEKIWRSSVPDTYMAMVSRAVRIEPMA